MRRERLSNSAQTTLSAGISGAVTAIPVTLGSVFPAEGDYHVVVNDEIMLVTARVTNTLTVVRGQEGTAAIGHTVGAKVGIIVTKASLLAQCRDAEGPCPETIVAPKHMTVTSSAFTWVNQGTSSVVDNNWGGICMFPQSLVAPHSLRNLVKTAPSTPYTVYGHVLGLNQEVGLSGSYCGLVFRETSSGRLITIARRCNNIVALWRWNSPTSFANQPALTDFLMNPTGQWYSLEDDGTNITLSYSVDGVNYFQLHTELRGTFFTTGPDQVGWFAGVYQGVGNDVPVTLSAWVEA